MRPDRRVDIKYTIRRRADGLGGQVQVLCDLLRFADRFDLSVLCDLRTFPFFKGADSKYYSDEEASRLLEFHPKIIYDSKELNSIKKLDNHPTKQILDWTDWWPLQCEIVHWLSSGEARGIWKTRLRYPHPTGCWANFTAGCATESQILNPIEFVKNLKKRDAEKNSGLPVRLRDRTQFESLLPRVKNSTVVHARLGNGEREVPVGNFQHPLHAKRMGVPKSLFFAEMEKHSGDFFVCSDDVRFVNECKELFGDRVFCSERAWLPFGSGPGHNAATHPYSVPTSINPWVRLGDALLDMELLCEGKHLICNKSQFNQPARNRLDQLKSTTLFISRWPHDADAFRAWSPPTRALWWDNHGNSGLNV